MIRHCLALSLLHLLAFAAPVRATEDRHVVLITLDGFPARMLWDEKATIPNIRRLASEGVAAEGLRICNPTVTWPNHTTLVTGVRADRHSVLYNGLMLRSGPGRPVKIDPHRDQRELIATPTIFEELHKAGMTTAAIDWPCTRNADALDDNFPDVPESLRYTTPRLRRELVAQHILPDESDASFGRLNGPGRDAVWTQAACHVLRVRRPQLLVLHLLNTDGIHHRYGPESPASYTALALADKFVGQVLDTLATTGMRTNTTVFVVADHGFANATNLLQPNLLFRKAGLLQIDAANQITSARVQAVPEGGTAMIYLTNPQTRESDLKQVVELLRGKEGVAGIYEPGQFGALGFPAPGKPPGMADLVLAASEGYAVSGAASGDDFVAPITGTVNRGYHGYLASNPQMNALFVAAGRGIKPRGKIGFVDNVDVAPTLAHLLGRRLAGAEGKVLAEILTEPE